MFELYQFVAEKSSGNNSYFRQHEDVFNRWPDAFVAFEVLAFLFMEFNNALEAGQRVRFAGV